ncbi:MAG TPA: xanthine dehydrogenase family protein molybdopterin-binding subunit [Acidimicrobiales bacterium]|nr:xanthine dehydrogenase family protein molybdopterin-binding subunit [Acidimicrobiales bacterium]
MSILGNRVLRKEDPKFLTTGGVYVDDLPLPGALHVVYVRSTMASARITGIDVAEASASPGVVRVFTGADVDLAPMAPSMGLLNQQMLRHYLATDRVRFVGEPIAAIVADTRTQAVDAADLVFVDYEPEPVVVDQEAAAAGTTVLFADAGTNTSMELSFGRSDDLFDDCEVVIRQRIVNQRVAPCPLEVRAAAAQWGEDGRLTQWATTQGAHAVRGDLARMLEIPEERIRVIAPDVGGGFGAKIGSYPEEILLPWMAKQLGRPLKWVETRSESMMNLGHGRGQVQHVELGGTNDGRITAYRLTVLQDSGAYPSTGSVLPFMTRTMLTGVYDIPKAEFNSRSVVTNTTPTVAYRGAGRPEATAAIERTVDLFAAEIGMDPAEVRRRNLIAKDRFPFTTPVGTTYDIGDYEKALDLVLEAAGYQELRAEQSRRRAADERLQLGIGLAVYVEITAGPGAPAEYGAVEVRPDGRVVVRSGSSSHGQGHHTAFSMLVADRLGVDLADIEVIQGDTDVVPRGQGTMGSRSLQAGGVAVARAADQVVEKAKAIAADLLEANPDDVVLDPAEARFHVAGTPAVGRTWAEVASAAAEGGADLLGAEVDFQGVGPTYPFGAHLVVVEVDRDTGKVRVERIVAVDDAGRILNPLLADGQVHGGLAQGVAQALLEEVRYDLDGNPITSNLADYAMISAAELPSFERISMETPTPNNELGAKGIGESGTIGSTPAVHNAVLDALAPYGVVHLDMPCTPEKVWRALEGRSAPAPAFAPPGGAGLGSVPTGDGAGEAGDLTEIPAL